MNIKIAQNSVAMWDDAITKLKLPIIKMMMLNSKSCANYSLQNGMSTLMYVCKEINANQDYYKVLEILLAYDNLNVNYKDQSTGFSALDFCLFNPKALKMTIKHPSININKTDNNGNSPLIILLTSDMPKLTIIEGFLILINDPKINLDNRNKNNLNIFDIVDKIIESPYKSSLDRETLKKIKDMLVDIKNKNEEQKKINEYLQKPLSKLVLNDKPKTKDTKNTKNINVNEDFTDATEDFLSNIQ